MKQRILFLILSLISLTAYSDIFQPYADPANVYHVRSAAHGGSNLNNCTAAKPCLTVAYAATKVNKPGSIIHVHTADGNFTETTSILLAKGVSLECDGRTVGKLIDGHVAHNENFIWMTSIGSEGVDNYQEIRNCDLDGNSLNGGYGIQVQSRNNVKIHDVNMENWLTSAIILNGRKDNAFDLPPNIFLTGAEIYNFTIVNSSSYTGSGAGAIAAGGTSGLKIHDGSIDSRVDTGRIPGGTGYLIKLSTPRGGFNQEVEIYKTTLTKKRQENFDFVIELWNSYGGNKIHDNIMSNSTDIDMCDKTTHQWCLEFYNNKVGNDTYAPLPFSVTSATWAGGIATLVLSVDAKVSVGDPIRITYCNSTPTWLNAGGIVSTYDAPTRTVTFPLAADPGTYVATCQGGAPETGLSIELDETDVHAYNNWFRNTRGAINFYYHTKDLETLGSSRYRYGHYSHFYIHDNIAIDAILTTWNSPSGAPHGYLADLQIINNTAVNIADPEASCGIKIPNVSYSTGVVIRNNILQGWPTAPICMESNANVIVDGMDIENNLMFNNGNSNAVKITYSAGQRVTNFTNQGNIIGDPLFTNYANAVVATSLVAGTWNEILTVGTTDYTTVACGSTSNGIGTRFKVNTGCLGTGTANGRDFRIQLASPAVAAGLETPFFYDYRGRYRSANPDIGAIQRCNQSNCETTLQMALPVPAAPF